MTKQTNSDPKPVKCPLEHVVITVIATIKDGYRVKCSEQACWIGPICKTTWEAIEEWNKVMDKE